jgi:uncharacterized protein (TIGR02246 family)
LLVAVFLVGACSKSGDEAQIESLVRNYLAAFASHDPQKFASYFSTQCNVDATQLQAAFARFIGQDIKVDVQSVDITNLNGTSATAKANGTATIAGRTVSLTGLGQQINTFSVVKENGVWKIGNCPNLSPTPSPGALPAG